MNYFCEKCGSKIDMQTGLCPNCNSQTSSVNKEKKPKKTGLTVAIICIVLVVAAIVAGCIFLLPNLLKPKDADVVLSEFSVNENYFVCDEDSDMLFTVKSNGKADIELYKNDSELVGKMNDDGKDGDAVENDGIYTCKITEKVEEDNTVTYNYVAKSGGATSEVADITFFAKLTEETAKEAEENYNSVNEDIANIEKEFADSTGYVPDDKYEEVTEKITEKLDEYIEDDSVLLYEVEDNSIYIKFLSGLATVYEPSIPDVSLDGTYVELSYFDYQPNPDIAFSGITDFIVALKENFDSPSANTCSGENVTLDVVKQLGPNKVIYWNGHGGYGPIVKSFLATGEHFDSKSWWLDEEYYIDCLQDRILKRSTKEQKNLACFTSRFVDKYCGDLANDLIILASCHSGQNSKLADSFLNKGATAVVGFTDEVYTMYCTDFSMYTLSYMTYVNESTNQYNTLSEAFALAIGKCCANDIEYAKTKPETFTELKKSVAEPVIFGGENADNYRLADIVEHPVKTALTPEEAVDIYMNNKSMWILNPEYEPMYGYTYSFLDLDFDGTLELIVSSTYGTGRFTDNSFYRINQDSNTVEAIAENNPQGGYGEYDLWYTKYPLLVKNSSGEMVYYCEDFWYAGAGEYGYSYGKLFLENDEINTESLFQMSKTQKYEQGTTEEVSSYSYYENGILVDADKDTYALKVDSFFDEYKNLYLSTSNIIGRDFDSADETSQKSSLLKCYKSFNYDGYKENEYQDDGSGPEVISKLTEDFIFSSGAGAWGTVVSINSDGSFTCNYHDSDMGIVGDNYPKGTVHKADATGKFYDIKRINDYTYCMTMSDLDYEKEPGTEEIVDGVKYEYSTAYGLDEAKRVYLYTPDAPISELPYDFLSWVHITGEQSEGATLGFYALYNVDEHEGFTSNNK